MSSLIAYLVAYNRYLSILGIALCFVAAYALSHNKNKIQHRLVGMAFLLQCIFAMVMLKFPLGKIVLEKIAGVVAQLYLFADYGAGFVFGNLASATSSVGFVFAFRVLPVTIFFSALMALLFHFNIVPYVIRLLSYGITPFLKISPAESVVAIANSFLGQTEAPLLVRSSLKDMTKSELFVVMLSGMATISGAILVVYAAMGVPAMHLLASSIMSIPGAILMAKIIVPETGEPTTKEKITFEKTTSNMFDAIASGTSDGLMLALNVAAFLISFLALLALGNAVIGLSCTAANYLLPVAYHLPMLSIEKILGHLLAPVGYLLGLTGREAFAAGQLLGIKVGVNELIAFSEMVKMNLSERAIALLTYVLCGFSNFSCIGIQIGALSVLAPNKRTQVTQLGIYAVIGAALTNLLNACIVCLLL